MKQTAVEWLVEQICGDHTSKWQEQIIQAKAMEKEQMKLAYNEDRPFLLGYETGEYFEEHYNENYEKKED